MSILRCNRGSRGALDIFLVRIRSENRNVNLLPERGELLDRRRPLQIAGNQPRRATLLFKQQRQLCRRSCFAGAVQSDQQNSARFAELKRRRIASEQDRQFIVKNLNDLLTGRDAAQNGFAQRFFFDACDEILRDLKIKISCEQREANLAQRSIDVLLPDFSVTAEILKDLLQSVAQLRKHSLPTTRVKGAVISSALQLEMSMLRRQLPRSPARRDHRSKWRSFSQRLQKLLAYSLRSHSGRVRPSVKCK